MNEVAISVRDLWKSYKEGDKERVILQQINLDINEGERIAIMGPSGSGKTTLLNVLSGLDNPTRGSVIIDGQDITKLSIEKRAKFRRKNVGFIFQSFNLIKSMTTLENIMLPLLMNGHSRSKAKQQAEEYLKMVGLSHRKNAYPNRLSGGEKQRVAIARSLIHQPKIVFADEPTGNLDRPTSREIINIMENLSTQLNQTTIIVTHDSLVAKACKKVYFLNEQLKEISKNEL